MIRIVAALALTVWLIAGVLAAWYALPLYTYASIAFFVVYFWVFVLHYWKMAYVVDEFGVTIRRSHDVDHHVAWEDIERVEASDIPLGGYYVSTKEGGFVLSTFVEGRERLLEMIIARAGLFPLTDS